MQKVISRKLIGNIGALSLMATVLFAQLPLSALADTVLSVTLTANGQSSLTLATPNDSFTLDLSTANALACQMTSPSSSGISTATSMNIAPGDPFYPAVGGSTTFTVTCTDGTANQSASVTVSLPAPVPAPAGGSTASSTPPAPPAPPAQSGNSNPPVTVDVKVNGSDGPVTLNPGDTYTYTWASSNAVACQQTSPVTSGISTNGISTVINASHPFYPTVGNPVTLTVTCTDGVNVITDSVVVNLAPAGTPPTPPAGGGFPPAPGSNNVTVDVRANGSDGPVVLNQGDTYSYSWVSANATACQQTSPVVSGISTAGSSAVIFAGTAFYPSTTTPVTITVTCTDGVHNATDSVVVSLGSSPIIVGGGQQPVTVDIKANGSDGPVLLNTGDTYTYSWTSTHATACQQTSPVTSGISTAGTSATISAGDPFYPAASSTVTLTITCTDGIANTTDSVVVGLAAPVIIGGGPLAPTVDIKANGSDGPVTLNQGDTYRYTWISSNATACQQTSPVTSGISTAGTSAVISAGDPFYPTVGGPVTLTIVCTNGITNVTDSVVVNLATPGGSGGGTPPSGGGGGGGGGLVLSNGGHQGVVATNNASCLYLRDYMRQDFNNDPAQVQLLQTFLKDIEGYSYVTVNGVFDNATLQAVDAFQMQYKDDILTPWGHTAPTGYVYILTLKKINEIYCLHTFPLNDAQAKEIVAFHDLIEGLTNQGLPVVFTAGGVIKDNSTTTSTTTVPIELPIVGQANPQGQNLRNLAAAIFAGPTGLLNALQIIYEFLLILIVLYILASVLEDVLYEDTPENVLKKFLTKWTTMSVGLVLAIVMAYVFREWPLILPLFIVLILSLVWMLLYPKHTGFKASTKAWYIVLSARTKSLWNKATMHQTEPASLEDVAVAAPVVQIEEVK